jgi:hypothetical protein
MARTGKEFVSYEPFDRAAWAADRERLEGARLSFNKYSGVQEWKNANFLSVNLGGTHGTVFNNFLDCGRQITWFVRGSRMRDGSPVVQRLLKLRQEEATVESSSIIL